MNGLRQEKSVIGPHGEPRLVEWELNLEAASRAQRWSRDDTPLLHQEVAEMVEYFPNWLLTVVHDEKPGLCEGCGELLVWKPKGLVCVACDHAFKGNLKQAKFNLAWIGHLPVPLPQAGPLLKRLRAKPNPAAPLIEVGEQSYLLVPLLASYPENWPQHAPPIRYDRAFLDWIGIKASGHTTHLVGVDGTTMCLYAAWHAVTLRVVLQQRVVNHVVSLFKIGQGVSTSEAFLQ